MISVEVASALAKFFAEGKGPSHDELTIWFRGAGVAAVDPGQSGMTGPIGKMKRVRHVLYAAAQENPTAGSKLVSLLVDGLRASGAFLPGSDSYADEDSIAAASRAFATIGYELDPAGHLRPTSLDNLEGSELTEALWSYMRRARTGAIDKPLVVGTSKDLSEAVARHAIAEAGGNYSENMGFAGTLYQAFNMLAIALPPKDVMERLDKDPRSAMYQSLYLAACAVNRLGNADGTGHGRPHPMKVSDLDARLAAQIAGLVSELLLAMVGARNVA
jgi:hypothetical protein